MQSPLSSPSPEILVIDDDLELRTALVDALREQGYLVATAGNGKEGLEVLREAPAPRLILLDL